MLDQKTWPTFGDKFQRTCLLSINLSYRYITIFLFSFFFILHFFFCFCITYLVASKKYLETQRKVYFSRFSSFHTIFFVFCLFSHHTSCKYSTFINIICNQFLSVDFFFVSQMVFISFQPIKTRTMLQLKVCL